MRCYAVWPLTAVINHEYQLGYDLAVFVIWIDIEGLEAVIYLGNSDSLSDKLLALL